MTLLTLHDCPSMFSFVFQSLISMDCDEDITPSDHQHNTSIEKTIPVLVPNRCHESLQWLSNYSVCAQVGIEIQKNFFASGPSKRVRHFMATMTQALALNDFQFQHVLKHLVHSRKVQLENYRLQAPGIERLEIAKILLIQDRGVQSNFRDKPLSEISYEEILSTDERQDNDRDEGN